MDFRIRGTGDDLCPRYGGHERMGDPQVCEDAILPGDRKFCPPAATAGRRFDGGRQGSTGVGGGVESDGGVEIFPISQAL